MKKHSATSGISQVFGFLLKTLFLLSLLISASLPVSAENHTDNDTEHNGTGSEHIKSVTLRYDDIEADVWNDIYTVDNGTSGVMNLHFEYDSWLESSAMVILVYSVTADGQSTKIGEASGSGVCDSYAGNSYDLPGDCGIRVQIWDWNEVVVDTMLGIFVKRNEAKELFNSVEVTIGPKTGASFDMSEFVPGMGFDVSPFPLPVRYEHFKDGTNVIGLGFNSSDITFWENAAEGKFAELSHGKLVKEWENQRGISRLSKLGFVWTVGGYAVSYDDNPKKMSGKLQFYGGTGIEMAGQYALFTYNITITCGGQGSLIFTLVPASEDKILSEFEMAFLAGVDIYGGFGLGCLLSAGVYGAANFTADFHVLPKFYTKKVFIDGEIGIKVKMLGRTVVKFGFNKRFDFYEKPKENGGESWALPAEANLQQQFKDRVESLIASGYGNQAYEVNETSGETIWHTDHLDQPDEDYAKLYAGSDGQMLGDRSFSKKLADNIHPENGIQIKNLYDDNSAIILLVGNNDSREPGKKGELLYSIYDHQAKTISEPSPVALDMDGDGTDDTGGDFSPRLSRSTESKSIFVTWLRGTAAQSADLALSDAASDLQLCFAKYDANTGSWGDFSIVSESNQYILGGAAVGFVDYANPVPYVFAYTNPEDDPAGLSENSEHAILMYHYSAEENQWKGHVIDHVTGLITRFDGGQYFFGNTADMKPAAVYSLKASGSQTVNVVTEGYKRTFANAWNGAFNNTNGSIGMTFMQDGALYFANGYRNDFAQKLFPLSDDEKIPEATYQLIGDLYGSAIIGYLKSEGTSQNLSGYARISSASKEYGRSDITAVAENTNVNYFDGVFVGDDEPVIVYSTQEYSKSENGEFVDGISNLYIQVGAENTHVSLTTAQLDNVRDLDGTKQAEISVEFRNNGLVPIDYVDVYARKVVKPESSALRVQNVQNTGTSEYISLGRQNLEKLLPGATEVITVTIPDTFTDEPEYTIALIGSSSKYPNEEIQTEIPVDLSAGLTVITDAKYDYRYSKNNDSYTVEIKAYGVKQRSGKVVFYNSETLEVYGEESFSGLKLGSTASFEFGKAGAALSTKYPNLAVRILENDEVLNEDRPTEKYRPLPTLPEWFFRHMDVEEIDDPEEETPAEPTPTPEPTAAPQPAPSDQPGNSRDGSSANTADSSDAGIYAGVLMISAVLSLILIYERRKRASS